MDKENIFNNITEYYESLSYYNRYYKDILFSIIFIILLILIVIYFYIKIRIKSIRKDWPAQRCNPVYIPFAGMIHQMDGKTKLESGQINFMYCQNNILNRITDKFFSPIYYIIKIVNIVFINILNALNYIRNFLGYIKERILQIIGPLILKIMDMLHPITLILLYIKDIFAKTIGILKSLVGVIVGSMYTTISITINFYKIMAIMTGILMGISEVSRILFPPLYIVTMPAALIYGLYTIILTILTKKLLNKVNLKKAFDPPPIPNNIIRPPETKKNTTDNEDEKNSDK